MSSRFRRPSLRKPVPPWWEIPDVQVDFKLGLAIRLRRDAAALERDAAEAKRLRCAAQGFALAEAGDRRGARRLYREALRWEELRDRNDRLLPGLDAQLAALKPLGVQRQQTRGSSRFAARVASAGGRSDEE